MIVVAQNSAFTKDNNFSFGYIYGKIPFMTIVSQEVEMINPLFCTRLNKNCLYHINKSLLKYLAIKEI